MDHIEAAHYPICFLQELVDVLESKSSIGSWLCIMLLEKLIEDRGQVGHGQTLVKIVPGSERLQTENAWVYDRTVTFCMVCKSHKPKTKLGFWQRWRQFQLTAWLTRRSPATSASGRVRLVKSSQHRALKVRSQTVFQKTISILETQLADSQGLVRRRCSSVLAVSMWLLKFTFIF